MKILFALSIAAFLILAGCAGQTTNYCTTDAKTCPDGAVVHRNPANNCEFQACPAPQNNSTGGIGMANPASKFCVDRGYRLDIRSDAAGAQAGYCIFPNGRECEEWALFRGSCTDADSFEMVESPGLSPNPKQISYKFYADGRLVLATKDLASDNNVSSLFAWLKPSDFAAFVKDIDAHGYENFSEYYNNCGLEQIDPNTISGFCPTDAPSFSLKLMRQGNEKTVSVYQPANRPASVDEIAAAYKKLFETNDFVYVNLSGCKLIRNSGSKKLGCIGCVGGISKKCEQPKMEPGWEVVDDPTLGSCTADANGACAYQPQETMTSALCGLGGGHWNDCGSACRGATGDPPCIMMCVQYCECGGIAGFGCPSGYFCGDYLPKGAADAMGICKRAA